MRKLECPDCGAKLGVTKDKSIAFCQYCGARLDMYDRSIKVHTVSTDETQIRETEQLVELLKAKYEIERQKELDKQNHRESMLETYCAIVFCVGCLGFIALQCLGISIEHIFEIIKDIFS